VNKAKAIFNYVRDTLSYSFYYDTKYGATGTLKHKKGNCVDHSHLLVSMYRTAGFKARYVHGTCKFNSGGVYGHVWTQVLIGKHWVCADATGYANQLGKINNWNTKSYKIHGKYASLPF
jgi:transglutaminase-like putative cysteine protease